MRIFLHGLATPLEGQTNQSPVYSLLRPDLAPSGFLVVGEY
jgi:hypothetical protein